MLDSVKEHTDGLLLVWMHLKHPDSGDDGDDDGGGDASAAETYLNRANRYWAFRCWWS